MLSPTLTSKGVIMRIPNTECRVCGKEYYSCASSRQFGGYKTVACSEECYQKYVVQVMIESNQSIEDLSPDLKNYAKEYIKNKKNLEDDEVLSTVKTESGEIELGITDSKKSSKQERKKVLFSKPK